MADNFRVRRHCAIKHGKNVQNPSNAAQAGEHAVLFGEDGSGSALIGINARVGGCVARGTIFQQCVFKDCGNPAACPIHFLGGTRYCFTKSNSSSAALIFLISSSSSSLRFSNPATTWAGAFERNAGFPS